MKRLLLSVGPLTFLPVPVRRLLADRPSVEPEERPSPPLPRHQLRRRGSPKGGGEAIRSRSLTGEVEQTSRSTR